MNLPILGFFAAALVLAATIILATTLEPVDLHPQPPAQHQSEPVLGNEVGLDELRDFTWYYGGAADTWRDRNPFVPYQQRIETEKRRRFIRNRAPVRHRLPPVKPLPPPITPRTSPVTVKKPTLDLPPIGATEPWVPKVYGQLHMADERYVHVERDGDLVPLRPGEAIGTWTLKRITPEHAVFDDGTGTERIIPLGRRGDALPREGE